jgi:hypothetical protein
MAVIHPVDSASAPAPKIKSPSTTPGSDYASVHAAATSPRLERIPVPEGETWEATAPGAHYAEIITGPRKGQFINLTHGERRGETFTIEEHGGRTFHVYTVSGKQVRVKPSTDASATTDAAKHVKHPRSDMPRKGERWAPVEGHRNYADILGGPRNGLFVNISGGVRDGMAFQIVEKEGKTFHVYGSGKHRQWIDVSPDRHGHKAATESKGAGVSDTATDASSDTGGTSAPGD